MAESALFAFCDVALRCYRFAAVDEINLQPMDGDRKLRSQARGSEYDSLLQRIQEAAGTAKSSVPRGDTEADQIVDEVRNKCIGLLGLNSHKSEFVDRAAVDDLRDFVEEYGEDSRLGTDTEFVRAYNEKIALFEQARDVEESLANERWQEWVKPQLIEARTVIAALEILAGKLAYVSISDIQHAPRDKANPSIGTEQINPSESSESGNATLFERAIAVMISDAAVSTTEVAKKLGVSRSTLYRTPGFKEMAEKIRKSQVSQRPPRRGSKIAGNIEAIDSDRRGSFEDE